MVGCTVKPCVAPPRTSASTYASTCDSASSDALRTSTAYGTPRGSASRNRPSRSGNACNVRDPSVIGGNWKSSTPSASPNPSTAGATTASVA